MGEYAEMEIERQMREYAEEQMGKDPAPARTAFANKDLQAFARDMGLRLSAPSPHHLQVRQDGAVFAEWWPGKGTTRMDGKRGPRCFEVYEFISWLKEARFEELTRTPSAERRRASGEGLLAETPQRRSSTAQKGRKEHVTVVETS